MRLGGFHYASLGSGSPYLDVKRCGLAARGEGLTLAAIASVLCSAAIHSSCCGDSATATALTISWSRQPVFWFGRSEGVAQNVQFITSHEREPSVCMHMACV